MYFSWTIWGYTPRLNKIIFIFIFIIPTPLARQNRLNFELSKFCLLDIIPTPWTLYLSSLSIIPIPPGNNTCTHWLFYLAPPVPFLPNPLSHFYSLPLSRFYPHPPAPCSTDFGITLPVNMFHVKRQVLVGWPFKVWMRLLLFVFLIGNIMNAVGF